MAPAGAQNGEKKATVSGSKTNSSITTPAEKPVVTPARGPASRISTRDNDDRNKFVCRDCHKKLIASAEDYYLVEENETPKVLDKLVQSKMIFDIQKKFKTQLESLKT